MKKYAVLGSVFILLLVFMFSCLPGENSLKPEDVITDFFSKINSSETSTKTVTDNYFYYLDLNSEQKEYVKFELCFTPNFNSETQKYRENAFTNINISSPQTETYSGTLTFIKNYATMTLTCDYTPEGTTLSQHINTQVSVLNIGENWYISAFYMQNDTNNGQIIWAYPNKTGTEPVNMDYPVWNFWNLLLGLGNV